uniref:Uncharacterized protein n=1 Tax=Ananas comosus var. bracteatus TaxID=296719 RepID=A0A6V7PKQ3_ANACO|nr:unnamed protein product [Ananas comosus var. bracteatus]
MSVAADPWASAAEAITATAEATTMAMTERRETLGRRVGMTGGPTAVLRVETKISHREAKPSLILLLAPICTPQIDRNGASVDYGSKALELLELRDGVREAINSALDEEMFVDPKALLVGKI